MARCPVTIYFFFNDTATTEIYTLSLHDALPISARYDDLVRVRCWVRDLASRRVTFGYAVERAATAYPKRSEEHTSELQSRPHLVCRLLLEKKKTRCKRVT